MKNELKKLNTWLKRNRILLVGILLLILLANVLVAWHVLTEKTVYYWDYSGYWTSAVGLAQTFSQDFGAGLKLFEESLRTDYNYIPILPIAFIMQAFGVERIVYVLSILNLYLIPFSLISAYIAARWFSKKINPTFYLSAMALVLLFPASLNPLIEGLPDVVGLFLLSVILLVFTQTKLFIRFDYKIIFIGVLLALFIVARRWYAFWVVGALAGLLIAGCYYLWILAGKKFSREFFISLRWPILNVAGLGLIALAIIAIFFPYTLQAFTVDYGDLYSAYSGGGVGHNIWAMFIYFGLVPLAMSLVGYGLAFMQKRHRTRRPAALFFVITAIVIFALFTRTQDFGPHHYYLLVPSILVGLLFVLDWLLALKNKILSGSIVATWIITLLLFAFVVTPSGVVAYARTYLFGNTNTPVVRTDLAEIRSLANYVDDRYTYVIASSGRFNDSLLRNVNLPGPYVENILPSAHIDKRDGFPNAFFIAEYVVVATPIQTHMPNGGQGQMVVTELAKAVLGGDVENLKYLKSFVIDEGVELRVYERVGEYSEEFISKMRNVFTREYGEYENLTQIGKEYL